jgi:hypothetical protein
MAIDATATRLAAMATVVLLAACATSSPVPDLAAFLERRATCDHFRGEVPDPPDPQRMREVLQGIADSCPGTDAQLAALRQRYRDDPVVTRQLAQFEDRVEP